MARFYKNLKENFLFVKDAIISDEKNNSGYVPIDPIFYTTDRTTSEYISREIIENLPEYFERVYPIGELKRRFFGSKIQAQAAAKALYEVSDNDEQLGTS